MLEARRVLILTADAGFGHRSAANAIAAALEETHGSACHVEIVSPQDDPRMPIVLRSSLNDYNTIVREMRELYKVSYQATGARVPSKIVERALAVVLYDVMRDLVRQQRPDVIVTTHPLYQAPLALYGLRRRHIPLLTVVTDLATVHRLWFHRAADLCLVPTPAVYDLAIENGLPPERVRITGIPVHPRFARETRPPAALRAELGWRPDLTTVLAVGSERLPQLAEVLQGLNHSGLPLQLVAVAGGADALYRQLQSVEWHLPTHIYNYVDNMPVLMHAADCVVCKAGGLIVTEALACGLPLLLTEVLPGQEVGNADYVTTNGAGERAEGPLALLEALCHWLADGGWELSQRAARARRLGRPRAAYDVAELAWASVRRNE